MEEIKEISYNEVVKIRREKLEHLKQAGKNPFMIAKYDVTHYSDAIHNDFENLDGKKVSIAGRIMLYRDMGKASFCHIMDNKGRVQAYVKKDVIGENEYEDFKKYDIGDIIGIEGEVFRTQKGEISVRAEVVTLLTKSLQPLPEKFHGLTDMELRYRQRYVDMIMNTDVKKAFLDRTKIIKEIRNYLDNIGFIEVETPILGSIASGAAARPFKTRSNALDMDMHLRIATELYLKRCIVGGIDRVYEMGKDFRNEGIDVRHNPEFTMIELYQAYTDYNGMMELCENMLSHVAEIVTGSTLITYQGTEIEMKAPWKRITMTDAVKEYSGMDFNAIKTVEEARAIAKEHHLIEGDKKDLKDCSKGDILVAAFEKYVEEKLIQPTFITDYPVEVSPLTKEKPDNPELTERFEAFIYGREIGNAYSELNDPIVQRERFMQQAREMELGDDEAYPMDEDFCNALEVGMPPTGGMGIGIDRMVMFFTDAASIRDVILFPTMKPIEQ